MWHFALTKVQIEQIEAVQKIAIHIVLNFYRIMPYMVMLSAANLSTLASHREENNVKEILPSHFSTYFLLAPPPPRPKRSLGHF